MVRKRFSPWTVKGCTRQGGSEVARVALVDENLKIVFDKCVRPYNDVVDYVTEFSGITAEKIPKDYYLHNILKTLLEGVHPF